MSQAAGSAPVPETQGTQRQGTQRQGTSERRLTQSTLAPRSTPYFQRNGASHSRPRGPSGVGGSVNEGQDENIEPPGDPTQQPWFQDPELHARKKLRLQQEQCQIRLLGQQNGLLQQLLNSLANRTSSPAHIERPGCNMTTAQQNQFRDKITAATQKMMWQTGFYPGDTEYDRIAINVLSKPNLAAAKAEYNLYIDLIKKAETAARNYRTDVAKKISDTAEELWTGDNGHPWDLSGQYVPELAQQFLQDDQYRTGGLPDYFGLEDYRKIVYASKPDPKEEEMDFEPHNHITHLSAHQLAFVEIKVRSLLKGEKSLPKYDKRRLGALKDYEEIVRKMGTVRSDYVTVCRPVRPLESSSTPSNQSRSDGPSPLGSPFY